MIKPESDILEDDDELPPKEGDVDMTELSLENLPLPALIDDSSGNTESGKRDLTVYDPLQKYLQEIKTLTALTKDEEHALAIRYRNENDMDAGYKLVVSNLKLVVMVAREYQRNVANILDLVQEGNIGLLEAVKQYDPFRGIRFASYAVYWIRAYMLRYLINNIRLVKIGTTQAQRKLFFNLQKEKEKLEAEGFTPEARLLAERLKVKESEVIEMESRLGLPDLSVDAPINIDGEGETFHNLISDQHPSAEENLVEEDFSRRVRDIVNDYKIGLDAKEIAIIDKRLFTEEPITLQEIADEYGLSRERIRQIETKLKNDLKKIVSKKLKLSVYGEVLTDD